MGVSLQKVAGLSGVLKVAISNEKFGQIRQKFGQTAKQSISIGWSAAAADAAGIHLTEGSSHAPNSSALRKPVCSMANLFGTTHRNTHSLTQLANPAVRQQPLLT